MPLKCRTNFRYAQECHKLNFENSDDLIKQKINWLHYLVENLKFYWETNKMLWKFKVNDIFNNQKVHILGIVKYVS